MALKQPDMESCKEKKKCLGGPNSGTAYDPASPCDDGFEFNESTCNCDALCDAKSVWTFEDLSYSYFGCSYSCSKFNNTCGGGCVNETFSFEPGQVYTTSKSGPLPHTAIRVTSTGVPTNQGCNIYNQCSSGDECYPSPCVSGGLAARYRIQDADGNWLDNGSSANFIVRGGVGGTFCLGTNALALCETPPTLDSYIFDQC